eukprot:12379740-Alexandrium_andersonii.AAC.1
MSIPARSLGAPTFADSDQPRGPFGPLGDLGPPPRPPGFGATWLTLANGSGERVAGRTHELCGIDRADPQIAPRKGHLWGMRTTRRLERARSGGRVAPVSSRRRAPE